MTRLCTQAAEKLINGLVRERPFALIVIARAADLKIFDHNWISAEGSAKSVLTVLQVVGTLTGL